MNQTIVKGNFVVETGTNAKGLPTARYSKQITVGKNKGALKFLEGYYFPNEERRENWVNKVLENLEKRIVENKAKNLAKEAIQENLQEIHPFKLGTILYDSWGWEQTNIDFYQVTKVNKASLELTAIRKNIKETQFMAGNTTPIPNSFVGEPFTKRILFYMHNNKPQFYLKSTHGSISIYDKGEDGLYISWYA